MRSTLLVPASLMLGLVLAACDGSAGTEESRPEGGTPGGRDVERETLVVVESLEVGPVRDEIVVSAKVSSRTSVPIFPKLSNLPVTQVSVEEGDRVQRGQVLMTLFDEELQLATQSAQAAKEEAERNHAQAVLSRDENKQRVLSAERTAQKALDDYERVKGLGDLATKQEIEDARVLAETAADDLLVIRFAERGSDIAVDLANIAVRKAAIEAEKSSTDLGHTRVRSPIDGIVSQRDIHIGELTSMSSPAFTVVDTDDLVLDLRVPQDKLARLRAGQPVEATSVTDPDRVFTGTVRAVNPVLDEATGTVHVLVDLVPAPGLAAGLFCEARIVTAARDDALLVSKRAVLYEDDQPVLFTVNGDGSAHKIAFVSGASTPTQLEIVSDLDGLALSHDLRVIVVGQENLKDGAPVTVVEQAF